MNTLEKEKLLSSNEQKKWVPPIFLAPLLLIVFIVGAISLFVWGRFESQNIKLPTLKETEQGISLYDRNDKLLCTVHHDRDCEPVPLDKMSKFVREGVIASEDRHFYEHHGIDVGGMARAAIVNYRAKRIVQGASTITQQLVRNLYLDKNDRSYQRKLKEVSMSVYVDTHYSKPKILEAYLNEVYFGDGVHGVERAAQHFFNKHANQLNLSESAFLVGLVRQPSEMARPSNRKLALGRRDKILRDLQICGYISEKELQDAQNTKLVFKSGPEKLRWPYYVAPVLEQVRKELGDKMWTQEWKVYTNLDPKAQALAEAVLTKSIKNAPKGIDQGAMVTMSVKDGAVLAMVGGVDDDNHWNRALAAHTAGSIFKPFVYLAGLVQGTIEPETVINDAPLSVAADAFSKVWEPKNFDKSFHGWMTARNALAFSKNVCAARVAIETGLNEVISIARAAGLDAQLDPYPSLALGSCAVSPLNMTTAYATLARGGVFMQPQLVRAIKTEKGKDYKVYQSVGSKQLDSEKVSELVDVLQDVVKYGTGTRASLSGIPVAGKTGTADKAKDIWFVGFTPDTVTTVWAGNEHNKPIANKDVTGGKVMAGIWHQMMQGFYQSHPMPKGLSFPKPAHALISSVPQFYDLQMAASASAPAQANEQSLLNRLSALSSNNAEYNALAKKVYDSGIAKVGELMALNTALVSLREPAPNPWGNYNEVQVDTTASAAAAQPGPAILRSVSADMDDEMQASGASEAQAIAGTSQSWH